MELDNIFSLFVLLVCIQYQNVSGFVPPYQMQYLETVTVPWPYNHYYPIYQQQPKQFNVSLSPPRIQIVVEFICTPAAVDRFSFI